MAAKRHFIYALTFMMKTALKKTKKNKPFAFEFLQDSSALSVCSRGQMVCRGACVHSELLQATRKITAWLPPNDRVCIYSTKQGP